MRRIPPRLGEPIRAGHFFIKNKHATPPDATVTNGTLLYSEVLSKDVFKSIKIPSELFSITRNHFAVIKCIHHISVLKSSMPKSWSQMATSFNDNIRLAFATDEVKKSMRSITELYIESVRLASITHYENVLSHSLGFLNDNSIKMDGTVFENSVKLATQWARNQLGRKLSKATLDEGTKLIRLAYSQPAQRQMRIVVTNGKRTVEQLYTAKHPKDNTVTVSPKKAQATSKKTVKVKNSSRFFIHSSTSDGEPAATTNAPIVIGFPSLAPPPPARPVVQSCASKEQHPVQLSSKVVSNLDVSLKAQAPHELVLDQLLETGRTLAEVQQATSTVEDTLREEEEQQQQSEPAVAQQKEGLALAQVQKGPPTVGYSPSKKQPEELTTRTLTAEHLPQEGLALAQVQKGPPEVEQSASEKQPMEQTTETLAAEHLLQEGLALALVQKGPPAVEHSSADNFQQKQTDEALAAEQLRQEGLALVQVQQASPAVEPSLMDRQQPFNEDTSSQASSAPSSQRSITSYLYGCTSPLSGNVIYKLSSEQTAHSLADTSRKIVLLGDENWRDFALGNIDISIYIFSGKITSLRNILDKIHTISKIEKLIICISSNNFISNSSLGLLSNIYRHLNDQFSNTTIFICLAGICSSLSNEHLIQLESVNSAVREKSSNYIVINPPDNFTTTNGVIFTSETKKAFYDNLISFLC